MSDQPFIRPFPTLTPAQRFHFEVHGYVIVPGVFTRDECGRMIEAMVRCRRDLLAANPGGSTTGRVKGARLISGAPHHTFLASMYEYDDALLAYTCHPRCVGMAEEVMGCEARITEFNGHLNSRIPGADFSKPPKFGFHNGVDTPFGSHTAEGLYHCNFVKTLTTLVDLGPDDGGTVVVAGSHKCPRLDDAINAAYEDRSLIHQMIVPAGSTLLFCETLIHATGQIRSDIQRAIIITGYGPTMYPQWDDSDGTHFSYSPTFVARIPASLRTLYLGRAHWDRQPRYRKLGDPLDTRLIEPVRWA